MACLLLSSSRFSDVFNKANQIISFFHRSPLKYAQLRQFQQQVYGCHKSLLGSVITRWGSQYTMLRSIWRSHEALLQWADKEEGQESNRVKGSGLAVVNILLDTTFRLTLEQLVNILEPLHQAQKMSEAQASNVFKVMKRWNNLAAELRKRARRTIFEDDMHVYLALDGKFESRKKRQTEVLHWVAYYLLPTTVKEDIPAELRVNVQKFISHHCDEETVTSFFEFRQQENRFSYLDEDLWHNAGNPKLFWLKAVGLTSRAFADFIEYSFLACSLRRPTSLLHSLCVCTIPRRIRLLVRGLSMPGISNTVSCGVHFCLARLISSCLFI